MNRRRPGLFAALVLFALIVTAAACRSSPAEPPSPTDTTPATSSPTPTPTPSPTTFPEGWTIESSRLAYDWHWPNYDPNATVTHNTTAPPLPELVTIGAGDHPNDPGERPYNRMSFSFTHGFPSYSFEYVGELVADGSGLPVPLPGSRGALRISFTPATAHTEDGTASTIVTQPPVELGMRRMVSYAQAGDFEGHVTYGIGIYWPIAESNPQIEVRAYEVAYVNAAGEHRYVVAIDVDATPVVFPGFSEK